MKKWILIAGSAVAAAGPWAIAQADDGGSAGKPNVLWILTDDHRYSDPFTDAEKQAMIQDCVKL